MNDYAVNKKAVFDYEILETVEAGIALLGFEVKAVRKGFASLAGSFAVIRGGEAYLVNGAIPPYQPGNTPKEYDPTRTRKLLLTKDEIKELIGKTEKTGLTLVPLKLYNKRGKIKLSIGLARHKKKYDKRETIKRRETEREMRRVAA